MDEVSDREKRKIGIIIAKANKAVEEFKFAEADILNTIDTLDGCFRLLFPCFEDIDIASPRKKNKVLDVNNLDYSFPSESQSNRPLGDDNHCNTTSSKSPEVELKQNQEDDELGNIY